MPTIGIISQKGGVGKTTTAVNLAAALAQIRKVLLIDMDPQANASSGLGVLQSENTIYHVLVGGTAARRAVSKTSIPELDLLPASSELAGAAMELNTTADSMLLLSRALTAVRPNYDFIVVDAPPSLGALTLNALSASDHLIVPLQTEYYALEGIASMMDTVERAQGSLNSNITILGILLTMFDRRTNLSRQVEKDVRRHFGTQVFETVIPRSVRLAEAPSYGQTIFEFAPVSPGAEAYQALSREVLERVSQA